MSNLDLEFDEEAVADLTTWGFGFEENHKDLFRTSFWREVLTEVSEALEHEIRANASVMLWNKAPWDEEVETQLGFEPKILITFPVGPEEGQELVGRATLDKLVEDCIDSNTPDREELNRWADYFEALAKRFRDAAAASETPKAPT